MQPVPPDTESTDDAPTRRGPLLIAIGATVGGLILLLVFAVLLFRGDADDGEPTPTPFPRTPVAQTDSEALVVGVSNAETISISLDAPVAVAIAGTTFQIEPQSILADGIWSPVLNEDGRGVWIYGTVVNYVVGLRDSSQNRALLESLSPGDGIILRTQNNAAHHFAFDSRDIVATTNRSIFAQNMPGISLVLVGTPGDDRLVVHGRYVVDDSVSSGAAGGGSSGGLVELGETAQLGDLQLAATGATYLFDRPEAPSGFGFYLVDFELQNVGGAAFDTSQLRLTLVDEVGNQYALNPVASQLGNNPRLSGQLPPGQATQATAGYQVPTGLNSVSLLWQVANTVEGSQVQVNIPFTGGAADGEGAGVALQQADVSLDGTSLLLQGQITNLGNQSVVVTEQDVSLTSDGTVYLILSTNPGFPWIVSPGQTLPFAVTFQRPSGSSAVFKILNNPFQLDGLR